MQVVLDDAGWIIDEAGGNEAMCSLFGVVPSAPYNWRSLGLLPAYTYPAFVEILKPKKMVPDPRLFGKGRSAIVRRVSNGKARKS